MPSGAEIAQALFGAWRLALLDRGAMRYFDLSHRGVWRSFWAAALCYLPYLLLVVLRLDAETIARSGYAQIFLVESIGYVVAWCGFPLLVLGFARMIGREEQGFDFIIAYNWGQVVQMALFVAVALIDLIILPPRQAGQPPDLLTVAAIFAALAYEWFIALVAIGAGGGIAVAVVALDIGLGFLIGQVAGALY